MKKQLIPLFVISIISLLGSLASLFAGVGLYELSEDVGAQTSTTENALDDFFVILGDIIIFFIIIILAIIFVATALLGAFGLACAINKGRFAIPCIVFGSAGSALSIAIIIASIADSSFSAIVLIPFAYFGLYAFFSAIAYRYRKNNT